ncbi:MAG: heavy-metal-associated domain-containing protein [Moraxellaceae bacterium]
MKKLFLLIALLAGVQVASAQTTTSKTQEVSIQTSAECGECEIRLEEALNYTKGIVFAELDLTTMKLNVKFKPKQITLEEIKVNIASLGYQADEVPADKVAFDALPACCKPGGMKE